MAAVSLFKNTNMAAVTSCENAILGYVQKNPDMLETADVFYTNQTSVHTNPVNPDTETALF